MPEKQTTPSHFSKETPPRKKEHVLSADKIRRLVMIITTAATFAGGAHALSESSKQKRVSIVQEARLRDDVGNKGYYTAYDRSQELLKIIKGMPESTLDFKTIAEITGISEDDFTRKGGSAISETAGTFDILYRVILAEYPELKTQLNQAIKTIQDSDTVTRRQTSPELNSKEYNDVFDTPVKREAAYTKARQVMSGSPAEVQQMLEQLIKLHDLQVKANHFEQAFNNGEFIDPRAWAASNGEMKLAPDQQQRFQLVLTQLEHSADVYQFLMTYAEKTKVSPKSESGFFDYQIMVSNAKELTKALQSIGIKPGTAYSDLSDKVLPLPEELRDVGLAELSAKQLVQAQAFRLFDIVDRVERLEKATTAQTTEFIQLLEGMTEVRAELMQQVTEKLDLVLDENGTAKPNQEGQAAGLLLAALAQLSMMGMLDGKQLSKLRKGSQDEDEELADEAVQSEGDTEVASVSVKEQVTQPAVEVTKLPQNRKFPGLVGDLFNRYVKNRRKQLEQQRGAQSVTKSDTLPTVVQPENASEATEAELELEPQAQQQQMTQK